MRVLLDTTFARRGPSGTAVYERELTAALGELGVEVVEASNPRRRPPAGGGPGSWRNAASDRWWTAVELPRRAREANADVLHHPLPARSASADVAQVVTIHDIAFERLPKAFDRRFRAFARRVHRSAARRADAVVCVSEATASDARALWGLDPRRIIVAPHGPGQRLPEPAGRSRRSHLLYVGDSEPRKNLDLLLTAYAAYREAAERPRDLIVAGDADVSGPGITVVQRPGPDELAGLYAGAALLVHPALHEGFGLTLAEAMTAGVPVLCARVPGVTETCGEAARYFDPRDPVGLARALAQLGADAAARRSLAARGLTRAASLSWESTARAHIAAYTLALERR